MKKTLKPGWGLIWRLNGACLGTYAGVWFGKLLWDARSMEWWGLGLMGLLLLAMGTAYGIRAIVLLLQLIGWRNETDTFSREVGKARSDTLASTEDLRKRGMTR